MLSIGIVIFREVLEISLILTALLAGTKDLQNRAKWVLPGVIAGIAGSCLVALFTDAISVFANGMGQEIFNAGVLTVASVLIIGTVVWMKRHGREITTHIKEAGRAVSLGEKPLYTLAVVVALAILREGSEIVLFTYGIIASGESVASLIFGGILGLAAGTAVGVGMYYGLVRISTRFIFSVTSWLLIFLAAGMISQATGFLQAGGVVPILQAPVWDTSAFLADGSLLGGVLHSLTGYTAHPSGLQLASYIVTLLTFIILMKLYGERIPVKMSRINVVGIIFVLCFGLSAKNAEATKKVYSPIVEGGEWELEARGGYDFDSREGKDGAQKQKYAVGYGVTERWFTELYGEIEKEAGQGEFDFTSIEWENRLQLTEQGRYWLDAGLYFAYETTVKAKTADKIEGKILLEKTFSRFTHLANIIFEKEVGGGTSAETEAGFAWSSRYRWKKYFEPGVEFHADFGELKEHLSYEDQKHQLGPVFYGKIGKNVKYDIGYLFGITDSAPEGMLKWVLEYELEF